MVEVGVWSLGLGLGLARSGKVGGVVVMENGRQGALSTFIPCEVMVRARTGFTSMVRTVFPGTKLASSESSSFELTCRSPVRSG